MNSATAQRPLHHTVGYDSVSPFPLFRIRPRLAPCAHAESVLRGLDFSFFGMGEGEARDGFLLEGGNWRNSLPCYLYFCGNSNVIIRLGHSFGLVPVQTSVFI